ncbi:Mut7-C RNAse domain-containing protein [Halobacteriales archaeon Cl-PHB]
MTRLLLDVMLGKLATYCRLCGYDAAYALDRDAESDAAVLEWAADEDRTVVTRDRSLAAAAPDAILVRSKAARDQLAELQAAGLALELADPPERCSRSNGSLERVEPDEPTPEYAPAPPDPAVWRCVDCGQHFWRGSHWDDVAATLAGIRNADVTPDRTGDR